MGNDSEHTYVVACAATFMALCPIFVGLRVYTRRQQKLRLGLDDWLAVVALILIIGCGIVTIIGVHLGTFGYPTPESDPGNRLYSLGQQLEWAFFLMVIPALGCIKLSFIFFFRRIFCTGVRRGAFSICTSVAAVLVVLWTVAFFFWFLLSCSKNMAGRWESHQTNNASCPTDDMSDMALAISDFITDAMILFLPVPVVMRLQMKTKRKIYVLAMFALGSTALVASIIRLNYFIYITNVVTGKIPDAKIDVDVLVTESLYWSMLEAGLALICCCLLTVKALSHFPGVRSVVASARSVLQIGSTGSGGSRYEMSRHGGQAATGSSKQLAGQTVNDVESTCKGSRASSVGDQEAPMPKSGIRVEHTIQQSFSEV